METLHSVDRRKREALDDSIDLPESSPRAPLVAWKHDQRIRDAILQATEDGKYLVVCCPIIKKQSKLMLDAYVSFS